MRAITPITSIEEWQRSGQGKGEGSSELAAEVAALRAKLLEVEMLRDAAVLSLAAERESARATRMAPLPSLPPAPARADAPVRHKLADLLNEGIKARFPLAHAGLKHATVMFLRFAHRQGRPAP